MCTRCWKVTVLIDSPDIAKLKNINTLTFKNNVFQLSIIVCAFTVLAALFLRSLEQIYVNICVYTRQYTHIYASICATWYTRIYARFQGFRQIYAYYTRIRIYAYNTYIRHGTTLFLKSRVWVPQKLGGQFSSGPPVSSPRMLCWDGARKLQSVSQSVSQVLHP